MIERLESWFDARGWTPFDFQRRTWDAIRAGDSGLVHAPTGVGKTYAVWLGALADAHDGGALETGGVRALWLTPLRALARDTADALEAPLESLGVPWRVELRTGDSSTALKAKQRRSPPEALVTTPESLSVLLSYPGGARMFERLRTVIVDEWHELIGSKRGVQTELCLARLRSIAPAVRTWGVSATLGNTDQAARTLVGPGARATLIQGEPVPSPVIETLVPEDVERYPWAGHIGIQLLDQVMERVERAGTTLLFTNTRSQAEIWFSTILRKYPQLLGRVAMHHGSLDRKIREEVERMLRASRTASSELRCVVCTSSLDLGVDFAPVDQVIQVGSPKGVARLVQRAGRSGHRPGVLSRVVCVPSHAFELVEFAAVRRALGRDQIEARVPIDKPFDVLAQHLVTLAAGGGVTEGDALAQVRSTAAFEGLSDDEWRWAVDFVTRGGPALDAYPDHARVITDDDGTWKIASTRVERRHRMGIGTIVADTAVRVQFQSGKTLGTIEESFVARLSVGDRFTFGGRVLELVRLRDMTATVRKATRIRGAIPRWQGGKMPLSSQVSGGVRELLERFRDGEVDEPEIDAVRGVLEVQRAVSRIPARDELLVEITKTRGGHHAFCYPFGGRLAHEGLGAVLAWRLAQRSPATVRATPTDYGIELFSEDTIELDEPGVRALFSSDALADDLVRALNATELARRQFREIARIAGLTFGGFPGRGTPDRHLQASSDMFYDVLTEFDSPNLLLSQAQREVLEGQLEFQRLREVMDRSACSTIVIERPARLTPLSFPIWAETIRSSYASSEPWEQRIRKMAVELEARAMEETPDA